MILRGENLTFSYGKIPVLTDVSLSLASGELVMLVGPNGSGKSTLLKLLSGFLRPAVGSVVLDGVPLADYSWRQRAVRQAYLSQDNAPALEFTVRESVMLGRNPHLGVFSSPGAEDEDAVERALEAMELTELADRPANRLSGGERQRAMLAAVLAQESECLLLDEPTSALDVRHTLKLIGHLRDLRGRCGILMVTHDLGLALRYADRIVLLKDGAVVASGPADETMNERNLSSAYCCSAAILRDEKFKTVVFYR